MWKETEARLASIEEVKQQQIARLEEISGLTIEEAKQDLLGRIEEELTHETAIRIAEAEARFKEDADQKAREIISTAIQRCAADQVSEATVSVVALPSDDMKGRIIGREGRNIRTIEQLTGCDLIIDDTPEAITLSSFDPVRRETARIALEKLIADGRIHPARIEETVEKARREVENAIKKAGEKAVPGQWRGLHQPPGGGGRAGGRVRTGYRLYLRGPAARRGGGLSRKGLGRADRKAVRR